METLLFSCVGGGPMQRLADQLKQEGRRAAVTARYSPGEWRSLMARGPVGRLRARAGAFLLYPIQMLANSLLRRPSSLVVTTNPFLLPFFAVVTRWLHRRPVVALVYDLYPDAWEVDGVGGTGRLPAWVIAAMNRYWFRQVDGAVFIGPRMAETAMARYGVPSRWTVLETGASTQEFAEVVPGDVSRTDLARWRRGRVTVSYVGNLGHVHDWDTLGRAVPRALEAPPSPVGVLVAGSGPGVARWREAWSDEEEVRFVGPLTDADWVGVLRATDISLVTLREGAGHTSIPSKTFSAMAAGSAIMAVAPRGSDLAELVRNHDCGRVVEPGDVNGAVAALEGLLEDATERARCAANALDAVLEDYDVAVLAQRWNEFLKQVEQDHSPATSAVKRGLDAALGSLLLIVAVPIMGVVALLIRLRMGRPILFRQERAGLDGRPFSLLKFRTMRTARPGEEGSERDAERITHFGRLLRATSLDELPSLWNVVKGDMSLVGPRPLPTRYLERYTSRQNQRHRVRPGITGLAQVSGRNALSWEERLELDARYAEDRSLLMDVRILFRTIGVVLRGTGISGPDHVTMPEFEGSLGAGDNRRSSNEKRANGVG